MGKGTCTFIGPRVRKVETALLRGRVVIENGQHKRRAGDGQFLKRGTRINI